LYFLGLDALYFKGVTIPQEEQENWAKRQIHCLADGVCQLAPPILKKTRSRDRFQKVRKNLKDLGPNKGNGRFSISQKLLRFYILQKYKFLAVNAKRTPKAYIYLSFLQP
jgi:hypothetical protein